MPLPLIESNTRPATTLLVRPSWFVIQLTITASLGGCLFGYDLGAISGTLSQLTTTFDLDNSQKELIVSILYMGGTIGAACGGSVCDRIGRKTSIILTDIIFIVGSLWLYFSSSYEQVIVGRFIIGIGIAISGIADVSYLHECSPIQYRGSIVSVNEACISLGFLLAYISGFIFSSHEKEEWRIVFGIAGFLAAIQFIGMLLLPESPEWLIEKGRLDDAKKASARINGTASTTDSNDNPTIATYHNQSSRSFGFIIRHRIESIVMILSQYRRQVYIALYLAIVQQLCGQTNILNYAPLIFEEATNQDNNEQQEQQQQNYNENNNDYYEYPEDDASLEDDWSMVIIGVVKCIVTILVIWKIEYIGRRRLLIFGNLLIAIGLLALIIAFDNNDDDDSSASTTFWSPLTNVKTFHLALPGVLLVVCGYSCSFGPLTWLLTSELFPTNIRGRALGASTIVSYMFGAISTQTFLFATSRYGPSFVFGMYCIITVCGVFFVYMAIPDTGEKTVPEIDDSLNDMPWWKYDPKILLPQYDSSTTPPPSLEMTSEQFSTTDTNNASTRTSSSSSLDQQHVLS
ncbi:MFS general substrate transporter [Fragilariopsis cylindrus CCMP1102]|uniref:Hexose transporter 1 n=1 Tax=Fragilariopsis cylindrus CCMP1102 TaxID=635003 RepID=A0A1E7F8H8_9STRA|nr:MFS general substrate transporter [Fragilariopsis cylindrus CCMP1102]|eukprot:OEU14456.1 MFS general substrate transporter [Fragilariopsis cylindrus CCMP1102]